jgi:hypothetical protein
LTELETLVTDDSGDGEASFEQDDDKECGFASMSLKARRDCDFDLA